MDFTGLNGRVHLADCRTFQKNTECAFCTPTKEIRNFVAYRPPSQNINRCKPAHQKLNAFTAGTCSQIDLQGLFSFPHTHNISTIPSQ